MSKFALVDCNNFYVSCERVFNPYLLGKPVVVLSNNDGIIVARSAEAKILGIPMAAPLFKHKDVLVSNNACILSSNYELYEDMSKRVMRTLSTFCSDIEIYSIDEAFMLLDALPIADLTSFGADVRSTVGTWTGIPVSVGIGSTKTLAKAANELAKKDAQLNGVLDLSSVSQQDIDMYLQGLPVQDVWGIGRSFSKTLSSLNIYTALDFKRMPPRFVRERFGVVGLRTQEELKGISCYALETEVSPRQGICCSRSFGRLVTEKEDLAQAVSTYVSEACRRLRSQNSCARKLTLFMHTSRFREKDPQYAGAISGTLLSSSGASEPFIKLGLQLLDKLYKPGYKYKKAGVILTEITDASMVQRPLFFDEETYTKEARINATLDSVNSKFGKNIVTLGSSGIKRPWKVLCEKRSPRYTSCWSELLCVK